MTFEGMNWLAVFAAAAGGFFFGAIWYSILAAPWMKAAGLSQEDVSREGAGAFKKYLPFLLAGLGQFAMAFTMAGLMAHMVMDIKHGLITAGIIWAGFVLPALVVNYSFQGRPLHLILIDGGHWLGVLLIIGTIIGAMGV